MDLIDVATLISSFVAVGALALGFWAYWGTLREQTYLEYTGRYHDLLKELAPAFLNQDVNPEVRSNHRALACVYLDLCSEEVKLRLRRRIPKRVWRDWSDGMRAGTSHPVIQDVWNSNPLVREYRVLRAFLKFGLSSAKQEYRTPGSVELDGP